MEAVLAFGAEVCAAAPERDRIDPWIVERVAELVHAEVSAYSQMDRDHHLLHDTEFPGPAAPPTDAEWVLLLAANPFCLYAARTRNPYFAASRLTDVVEMDAFRRTELYEVMGSGLPHDMQTWMPGAEDTRWSLEVARAGRNFSDREVLVMDSLRPWLMTYEAHRALLERVTDPLRAATDEPVLSTRENEVLDLVARGASNGQIAQALWIAPGTVRKHLEHIYAKLEVGSRTAALARTGRSATAGK